MMKKVVTPMLVDTGAREASVVFCEITYSDEKRLSITGVVGPRADGNSDGGCGQIDLVKELTHSISFCRGWYRELVLKFAEVWKRWHLNDMRALCEHQRQLGWSELGDKEVVLYNYVLKGEWRRKKKEIEADVARRVMNGESVKLDGEDLKIIRLSPSFTTHEEAEADTLEFYKPREPLFSGDKEFKWTQSLRWLTPDKHPDGILTKPCPVCGYKYGTKWLFEPVPDDVIKFLDSLPDPEYVLPGVWRE